MLNQEQLEKFGRDGFVLGSRLLPEDELQVLRDEVLRIVEDEKDGVQREHRPVRVVNMGGDNEIWQIINVWEASEPFERLVHNATIAEEIAQLLPGNEIRLWHDQIQYKPAGTGGVNMWHQDSPYWILQPKDVELTAWIALDDADEDNGCMSMVRGSHLWGDQIGEIHKIKSWDGIPSEWNGHEMEVIPCPVPAGSVHFHHPFTWHGSPANRSGRPRRALALHFMTDAAKPIPGARSTHPMGQFIEGGDDEPVYGAHFPKIWPRS